jgi:hypothetical protein
MRVRQKESSTYLFKLIYTRFIFVRGPEKKNYGSGKMIDARAYIK